MRVNIHYKITFIFLIITAFILIGIYFYLNTNLREYTYQRIETNLAKEIHLVKSFVEEILSGHSLSYEIDKTTDEISKDLGLRVTVIGLNGTVFGDSELQGQTLRDVENHLYRPEIQQAIKGTFGKSMRFSTTVKKHMLYMATTFGRGELQGVIRLSMPLSDIELISNKLKRLLIISVIVAFFLSVVIGFVGSIFISRPIINMSHIAQNIAIGDFTRRISVSTNDEIGDLAKAFNYMSEEIKSKINELISNKSRLEAVLLSIFDGIMVLNSEAEILLINKSLKNALLIEGNPHGKKPLEVIRNIEINEIADMTLKSKEGLISREISILMPEEKILLVHATPVLREERVDGAVLVFHDITELKRLEKIRRDFVANVSHELKTPLSSITGYTETLLDGAMNDKKRAREFLEIIHSDAEGLANLINDLLDLSKIESGKISMALKTCAIRPIVERIIKGFKKQTQDKSINIKVDIPKDIPQIICNEAGISQVLLNLIDNSIKYTKSPGEITISAKEKDNKFITISVSDTGIGIPEKDIPRIFERFYRVDKARSRELGGTGLGLSIVKHIIQAHNGAVSVKSILGQGSTFIFTVPKA